VRRKRRKLQLFYNIVNKNTPNYLCTLNTLIITPSMQWTRYTYIPCIFNIEIYF
jgi:hypothetical protein